MAFLTSSAGLRTGQTVTIPAITGEVTNVSSYNGTVEVYDPRTGKYSYINVGNIEKPVPYVDGRRYISASGTLVTFRADPSGATSGMWVTNAGSVRDFSYPTRPLREVTVGTEELSD